MSNSTTVISDWGDVDNELACYLHADAIEIVLPNMPELENTYEAKYDARYYDYRLPLGKLHLLELVVYLPYSISSANVETVRRTAVKSALAWHKIYLSNHKNNQTPTANVLVFDIQFKSASTKAHNLHDKNVQDGIGKRFKHGFAPRYFMEDLIIDISDSLQPLQIFSWHDWHSLLAALQTPCELWRFLAYRLEQLQHTASSPVSSSESEDKIVTQFLNSPALFAPAIAIDNALIKYGLQHEPNSALIAMTLAQKNHSTTAQMYQQHMVQAAILWSQLSTQMIAAVNEKLVASKNKDELGLTFAQWQQQILDESLFSCHELVRTLYRHPKQEQVLQKKGYVVHQHSYESLGRHYVLIFYGQESEGQHSKATIQPNLSKIAQDVATRLPVAELHHIIVLGIDFITEAEDTFIDIDLWIQPVAAMTQRERQLTKQIKRLHQQSQNHDQHSHQSLDEPENSKARQIIQEPKKNL
ncbi:hypothetical protein [Psychrobacter sp. DAB_AL62B]|uniref:hypothetical protein n=1 Tax=Psychrobacter sp. DAB_AL62B TaxID=1028420 RepID=UPI0023813B66|nr:hypothetical protein [Psychrobacter sp. DAB_AL62B]MDE4455219.1 hypothetical protein [Psychrobacter sp. DAB_AL62B]